MPLRNVLSFVTVLALALCSLPTWGVEYRVGAATQVITPPLGSLLAGYGRDRAATGVHSDLFARAVVIDDGHTKLALVTLDSIGLTRPDILVIRTLAAATVPGLDASRVVISSTHTHAGPDVVGLWGTSFRSSGRDDAYMEALFAQTVSAISIADKAAVAASRRIASSEVVLPWVENRSEPELLDSRMSVLQFVDDNGMNIATLTNFSCHPTVLDGDNTLVSSDYVGSFYSAMQEALSGEHLFLQGAIGGWVQPIVNASAAHGTPLSRLDEFGNDVAKASLALIEQAEPNPSHDIEFRSEVFDIALDNWGFRLMMWLGVLERESFDDAMRTEATWFRLGNAEFVTHPGETSPAWSIASRELMSSEHSFVLGLTQDAIGYILKPEYFADDATFPHAEYLRSVSVGQEAGPRLMTTLKGLIPEYESAKTHKQ